jgi:hypothetical protein
MAPQEKHKEKQPHALVVGDRAHRIIARVLRAGVPETRQQIALELSRHARSVFAEHPVDYRTREVLVNATTAAGVYLQRFRPLPPWRLLSTEMRVGRHRLDVVHQLGEDLVVVDEIKLGVGRANEAEVRKQIDRYLELGSAEWGARFQGVRLCAIHEPTNSRFYVPGQSRSALLAESHLDAGVMVR